MKSYEIDVTFGIDAMHDESAVNKLKTFLSGLDLKKNDKIYLIDPDESELLDKLIDVDEDIDFEDEESGESSEPELSLAESDDGEWDESWEDLEWDDLD